MTNSELLKEYIKNSGLKLSYIAQEMKISRAALHRKINNLSSFNQYEMEVLCKILDVKTLKEKEAIFFAKNVD